MHAPVYRFATKAGHGWRGAVLGLCFWLCVRLLPVGGGWVGVCVCERRSASAPDAPLPLPPTRDYHVLHR